MIALQADGNSKPLYKYNIINSLPAIKFDGVDDFFDLGNIAGESVTIFAVLKTATLGDNQQAYASMPILYADVGGPYNDTVPLAIGGGFVKNFVGSSEGIDDTVTGSINVSDDVAHIISITRNMNNGARYIYVDGRNDVVENISLTGPKSDNPTLEIGGNTENDLYYSGYLAEIIIFDHVLKSEQRKAIEAYLSKKWKIIVS